MEAFINCLPLIDTARLCSSSAWWPLGPNFCSCGTRKSSFFRAIICWASQILQAQRTGLPSTFLRAQPCPATLFFPSILLCVCGDGRFHEFMSTKKILEMRFDLSSNFPLGSKANTRQLERKINLFNISQLGLFSRNSLTNKLVFPSLCT